jgi:hypothetical protein
MDMVTPLAAEGAAKPAEKQDEKPEEPAAAGAKGKPEPKKDAKPAPVANTSTAAKALLDRYTRRPRT